MLTPGHTYILISVPPLYGFSLMIHAPTRTTLHTKYLTFSSEYFTVCLARCNEGEIGLGSSANDNEEDNLVDFIRVKGDAKLGVSATDNLQNRSASKSDSTNTALLVTPTGALLQYSSGSLIAAGGTSSKRLSGSPTERD